MTTHPAHLAEQWANPRSNDDVSTWIYLVCEDHDPPLDAQDESGQHLYDLPQIRADIADREALLEVVRRVGEVPTDLDYFRRHTLRFFVQHPKCSLGIRDEYGDMHPLVDPEDAPTNPPSRLPSGGGS